MRKSLYTVIQLIRWLILIKFEIALFRSIIKNYIKSKFWYLCLKRLFKYIYKHYKIVPAANKIKKANQNCIKKQIITINILTARLCPKVYIIKINKQN